MLHLEGERSEIRCYKHRLHVYGRIHPPAGHLIFGAAAAFLKNFKAELSSKKKTFTALVNLVYWFISLCTHSLEIVIVSGLLVYLVYLVFWFISPWTLSLDSGLVSGLLVYLIYWFISPCTPSRESGIMSGLLVYLVKH